MTPVAALVGVTLRGLLSRRRTLLLVLLAGMPVLLALLIRAAGGRPDADRVLDTLGVRTILPLVALIVGTAAFGPEIEDGTAVYLLTKPVPRWQVVVAKAGVAAGLTAALVVPSVVLSGLLLGSRSDTATTVVSFGIASLIGGSAYAIGFVALSIFTSRALLIGLAYVLLWEGVLAGLLEGTKYFSIRQATLGIADFLGAKVPGTLLPIGTSLAIIAVVIGVGLALGTWRLIRFEVRGGD